MTKSFVCGLWVGSIMLFSTLTASAQSMAEENAQMSKAFCEWSFKDKQGKEACPLLAMGAHGTSSNVMVFRLDGMTISLDETHGNRSVEIGEGGFWDFKSKWSGTYKESYHSLSLSPSCILHKYLFSNGYNIKMVICN